MIVLHDEDPAIRREKEKAVIPYVTREKRGKKEKKTTNKVSHCTPLSQIPYLAMARAANDGRRLAVQAIKTVIQNIGRAASPGLKM